MRNSTMNKVILTMLLSIMLFVTGCKPSTEKVPLIIYNQEDPYMYEFQQYIIDSAPDSFKIEAYDSQNSQIIQNELIVELIKQNPKVLIINPVDRLGAYTIIDKVKEANIPTIFINREPLSKDLFSWSQVYYVGAPAASSAILQSEMVIDLFGEADDLSSFDKNNDGIIQLVVLKGEQGHQDAEIRTEVIIRELEDYGYELDIIALEVCDWKRLDAYDFMMELLVEEKDNVELVVSNNDAMAIGAIYAMMNHEMFEDLDEDGIIDHDSDVWIPVLGIDGISDAVDLINTGYLYGTVLNDSEQMAAAIVELANALINGENTTLLSFPIYDNKYIWVDYQKYVYETE